MVTVDGDTGQLMDGEVSELKVGLTCKVQKVLATLESLVRRTKGMSSLLEVEIYWDVAVIMFLYDGFFISKQTWESPKAP